MKFWKWTCAKMYKSCIHVHMSSHMISSYVRWPWQPFFCVEILWYFVTLFQPVIQHIILTFRFCFRFPDASLSWSKAVCCRFQIVKLRLVSGILKHDPVGSWCVAIRTRGQTIRFAFLSGFDGQEREAASIHFQPLCNLPFKLGFYAFVAPI